LMRRDIKQRLMLRVDICMKANSYASRERIGKNGQSDLLPTDVLLQNYSTLIL
jgi:hypothetical protein